MSSTLAWKPVDNISGELPNQLKRVLSRKLWGTDGSCGDGSIVVGDEILAYLEGCRDSGVDGAQELMNIISENGRIELFHHFG